jgi:hypothetical protein
MNIVSARAALRNPPRLMWVAILLETATIVVASLALVALFAA